MMIAEKRKRIRRVICNCCSTTNHHLHHNPLLINSIPKRRSKRGRITYCLPSDVIEQVFLRLPARSVVKLRSACKLFDQLTTTPHFVSAHTRRSRDRSLIHRLPSPYTSTPISIILKENSLQEAYAYLLRVIVSDHKINIKPCCFPSPATPNSIYFLGSQDGLLCFSNYPNPDHDSVIYTLFNPITHEQFSSSPQFRMADTYFLALYYHVPSSTYRLLWMVYNEPGTCIVVSFDRPDGEARKTIIKPTTPFNIHLIDGVLLVQPFIYVFASTGTIYQKKYSIAIFDTGAEQFTHHFPLPADMIYLKSGTRTSNKLIEIGGKLCVCKIYNNVPEKPYFSVELWVLKDEKQGIWVKKSRIIYSEFAYDPVQTYDILDYNAGCNSLLLVNPCDNDIASPEKELTIFYFRHRELNEANAFMVLDGAYRRFRMMYRETLASVHMQH